MVTWMWPWTEPGLEQLQRKYVRARFCSRAFLCPLAYAHNRTQTWVFGHRPAWDLQRTAYYHQTQDSPDWTCLKYSPHYHLEENFSPASPYWSGRELNPGCKTCTKEILMCPGAPIPGLQLSLQKLDHCSLLWSELWSSKHQRCHWLFCLSSVRHSAACSLCPRFWDQRIRNEFNTWAACWKYESKQ